MSTPVGSQLQIDWQTGGSMTRVESDLTMRWFVETNPVTWANNDFFSSVEPALKELFTGIVVSDVKGGNTRPVKVIWHQPMRAAEDQEYPFLILSGPLAVEVAHEREQRGRTPQLAYVPSGYEAWTDDPTQLVGDEMPLPYDITYQLTSHAREYQHDRQIILRMMQDDMMPARFGMLATGSGVNQNRRYLDLVSGPVTGDTVIQGKRLFRKIWALRISAELFQRDLCMLGVPTAVDFNVEVFNDEQGYSYATGDSA